MEQTVCELFAGVGGFRVGLERSSKNWNVVWANQWEPNKKVQHAFDCYCTHYGKNENHVNEDISEVDKSIIPDFNLLVGGFPCQDYSVARSLSGNHGIEGKKGVLWWSILDVIKEKKPSFILLENVDRLLKSPASQRGRDFGIMLSCLNQEGYYVEWRVINAAEYGYGQRRRRVFIFAVKNDTVHSNKINNMEIRNQIEREGFFAKNFLIKDLEYNITECQLGNDLVDISNDFEFNFENCGVMRDGRIYTVKTIPIMETPTPLNSLMQHDVDEKYFLGSDISKWEYLKGGKRIERQSKSGHNYIYSEGSMAFPDDIELPARTILTSESSVNRSTHVVRDLDTGKLRLITPIEAERIQGFPDDWTNTGMTEKMRYFCMGNSLVVHLIERMGQNLEMIFREEKQDI